MRKSNVSLSTLFLSLFLNSLSGGSLADTEASVFVLPFFLPTRAGERRRKDEERWVAPSYEGENRSHWVAPPPPSHLSPLFLTVE